MTKPTALSRIKASFQKALLSVSGSYRGSGSWVSVIQDPYPGAFQKNQELKVCDSTSNWAVYACVTLISSDIGKLPFVVKRQQNNGWWQTQRTSGYSWLNTRPNHYQTSSKFKEQWMISKLLNGNAYALKQRDARGRVTALYILDPTLVTPLVSNETGEVFYQLSIDNLAGISENNLTVPASEIIHDRMNCLFHPLVGISPLYAAGYQALLGKIGVKNATNFFMNASNPGGILTAPGELDQGTVDELKSYFSNNFSGPNAGRIAVVSGGLKFEKLATSAQDSQLLELLQWTAETICACFHVPSFMVMGTQPGSNAEVMTQQYYSQCLQSLIISMQESLDEGLELEDDWGIELDIRELIRADSSTRVTTLTNAVKGSLMTVNEARLSEDLEPVEGGDSIWMQQQNYSLEALVERDQNSPLITQTSQSIDSTEKPDATSAAETIDQAVDAGAKVQDLALNGAQVSSLLSILHQVSEGLLPLETARAIIAAAFPGIEQSSVDAMLDPLEGFVPATVEPVQEPIQSTTEEPASSDSNEEEMKSFIDSLKRGFDLENENGL